MSFSVADESAELLSLIFYIFFYSFFWYISYRRAKVSVRPESLLLSPVEFSQMTICIHIIIDILDTELFHSWNSLFYRVLRRKRYKEMNTILIKFHMMNLEVGTSFRFPERLNHDISYRIETLSPVFCTEYDMIAKTCLRMVERLICVIFCHILL